VDEEISAKVIDFLDRNDPRRTNKPFFVWYNPARMHVTTVLPPKYLAMLGEEGGKDWGIQEAGIKNTPIPGVPEVPGAVDPKTTTCLTPPRPVLACTSSDGSAKNQTCKDEGPLTLVKYIFQFLYRTADGVAPV
jgi:hypothetical protein